jgi:hypothetical protein
MTSISKKDFRKEITKLKKDLRTWMNKSESNKSESNKSESSKSESKADLSEGLEEMRTEIFSTIDKLPVLFMNRRKKTLGGDDPAKNLIGFGKPTCIDRNIVDFFEINFGSIDGKTFEQWFPCLSQLYFGSRIQLQSLFNLIIRITDARVKEKKREQISVKKMKNMDRLLVKANEILANKGRNAILNKDSITSSDLLKILNIFALKDSELTLEQKMSLERYREDIRNENIVARKLLEGYTKS